MKKISLSIVFIFAFSLFLPLITHADLAPQINITESHLNSINKNQIQGEFTIENDEKYYLSDLNYEIKLLQGADSMTLRLIDVSVPTDTFFVPTSGTVSKNFTYIYPQNIKSGKYTLLLQTITSSGTELGWKTMVIDLAGSNNFLNVDSTSAKITVGKNEATPLSGPSVSATDSAIGSFSVQNPGDKITVVPQIRVFDRQVNKPIVKQYSDAPITFNKGETKTVSLTMPKMDKPGSYLAEVKLFKDNQQVSGIQYFRWVLEGSGGKLIYVKADKDYYKAGDNINLTVQSVGPADGSDLGTGQVVVTASDKNGKLIGTATKDVALNFDLITSIISIPVKSDITAPKINVKLIKDGKTLDEQNINLPVFSKQAQQLNKDILLWQEITYAVWALALILVLIAGFFFYKSKNQKKK